MPHFRGHYRDTFCAALYAYQDWKEGEPEPAVEFEVHYEPEQIPISEACGLLWNCTDILPHLAWQVIEDTDLVEIVHRRTYGAAARAMHQRIQERTRAPVETP